MVHETDDVVDHVDSVGVFRLGFVRVAVAAAIQRDDLKTLGEPRGDAGRVPIHAATGIEAVDEKDRFAVSANGVMDFDTGGIEIMSDYRHGGERWRRRGQVQEGKFHFVLYE